MENKLINELINKFVDTMMIGVLLDETTEEFEMLEENFRFVIETILEDCYGNLFSNEDTWCEKEELLKIIDIPMIDVLKNPPHIFKHMWSHEINCIVDNYGGKHKELGKWFNKYFTRRCSIYWEDLEGKKLKQYNKIYQKQLDYYLKQLTNDGRGKIITNMDYLNRLEQERQQYVKQIRIN